MFTNEEANHLLSLLKQVEGNASINLSCEQIRLPLTASDAPEYKFLAEININKKIGCKISLHHQEHTTYTGLLRIDYRGRHTNPSEGMSGLPEKFRPYMGKTFDIEEPHVHYYVAGYKPLAWAIPLSVSGLTVPQILQESDIPKAILEFANAIHIISHLSIQSSLI
jgi:hypothetical protein